MTIFFMFFSFCLENKDALNTYSIKKNQNGLTFSIHFILRIMRIGQIEHEILTFPVLSRKYFIASSRQKKTLLLPGISYFLPAGDMGGEII